MKKVILLFALFGFFLIGLQSVSAQVNYSITINWDDESCGCTSITIKKLTWALERIGATPPQIDGESDKTVTGTSYSKSSNAPIITDCPGCYRLTAKIDYYENSEICCTGTNSVILDGDDLVNSTVTLNITMY